MWNRNQEMTVKNYRKSVMFQKTSQGKVAGSTVERPGTPAEQVPLQPPEVCLTPIWPNPTAEKSKRVDYIWGLMGLELH